MVESNRRKLLKTGAGATVIAAAPRALAEQAGREERIPPAIRQIRSFLRAHRPA
jgi:hypothetical protein